VDSLKPQLPKINDKERTPLSDLIRTAATCG